MVTKPRPKVNICLSLCTIVSQVQFVYLNAELLAQKVNSDYGNDTNVTLMNHTSGEEYPFNQPTPRVNHEIFTKKQLDIIHRFYTNLDQFHGHYTVAELGMISSTAKFHSAPTNEQRRHRYDSLLDMRQSFGPHLDNEHCLRTLGEWNHRAELLREQKLKSKDLNFYRLLDSYGRVSAGMVADRVNWVGMYEDCLRLKIDSPGGANTPTRYCLASIKHQPWPPELLPYNSLFGPDVGVCLPRSCDPLRYKDKYKLIMQLIEFNWRDMEKGQATLESLYCVPDEDSPLRMWWRSPWVLLAMILGGTWSTILIYATIKYEQLRKLEAPDGYFNVSAADSNFSHTRRLFEYYQILSIVQNFRLLFDRDKPSSKQDETSSDGDAVSHQLVRVDFRCLNGIKVISMMVAISAHVLLAIPKSSFARTDVIMLEFVMMAALIQSLFFTVSGILTCYFLFKRLNSFSPNPINWLPVIVSRYLRVMPIYIVHVYYFKYLVKFAGSGPMWDYGTSSLDLKRQCENESWLRTLLFGANFKVPLNHCIETGWYLANDFQFFLVTPIFLFLLQRRPAFGQRLLQFCIASSCLAGVLLIYLADVPDMRPLTRPMPHSFNTLMAYQAPSYTQPHFRISAYLCGLLIGFKLYTYELAKKRFLQAAKNKKEEATDDHEKLINFKYWPDWLINRGWLIRLAIILGCLASMIFGFYIDIAEPYSNLFYGLFVSINHVLFALSLGTYTLTATTGYGNKFVRDFLSASFWKPLARLSLCVSMINIEFIGNIDQNQKQQSYVHSWNLAGQLILTILGSYSVATVTYLVFEAPISRLLSHWRL